MNIICNEENCKFKVKNAEFCNRDFLFLDHGLCKVWYINGQRRVKPMYSMYLADEAAPQEIKGEQSNEQS